MDSASDSPHPLPAVLGLGREYDLDRPPYPQTAPEPDPTAETAETAEPTGNRLSRLAGRSLSELPYVLASGCRAPGAMIALPSAGGDWKVLAHGLGTGEPVTDQRLLQFVARSGGPVEVADLTGSLWAGSPLLEPPHNMRWAFGLAIGGGGDRVRAVLVVLDRGMRRASRREERLLVATASLTLLALGCRDARLVATSEADAGAVAALGAPRPADIAPAGGADPTGSADPAGAVGPPGASPRTSGMLRSQDVAALFSVSERTVLNWAAARRIPSVRTPGGQLRFPADEIYALLAHPHM